VDLISGSSRKVGFTHKVSISELLHFFHCLHVQEKHVTTLFDIYLNTSEVTINGD